MNGQNFANRFLTVAGFHLFHYVRREVAFQNKILKAGQRFFNSDGLVEDVNAIFVLRDHFLQPAHLPRNNP